MDDTRFDDIAKALGSVKSRRLAIGALLGGGLSALGTAESEAKKKNNDNDKDKKKKCKKKAGPCEKCNNKGRKKDKANGSSCTPPGGGSGQCANGACIAQSPPVPPAPPSPVCVTQGNPCVQGGTGTAACCAGTVCGRAFGATAGSFNCCSGPGSLCNASTASQCCSQGCNTNTNPPTCACKTTGTACDDNSQCCSNRCVTSGGSSTCAAAQSARG